MTPTARIPTASHGSTIHKNTTPVAASNPTATNSRPSPQGTGTV